MPDLEQMIEAHCAHRETNGPNARLATIASGFQALMNGFPATARGDLKLNSQVARVVPSEHRVILHDGTSYAYEHLISTMPLPVLVDSLGGGAR